MNRSIQFYQLARNILLTCFAAGWLTACGGSDKIDLSSNKNVKDAVDAATGPLEDLNIRKREIPEPLKLAVRDPYATPEAKKCDDIRGQIAELDDILGADMQPQEVEVASADDHFLGLSVSDVKMPTADQVESSAGGFLHNKVMDFISSKVNILPFRSIVRTVSGADRYQKKVTQAYEAGKLRRAYLKGYAQEKFGRKCLTDPFTPPAKKDEPPPAEQEVATAVTEEPLSRTAFRR